MELLNAILIQLRCAMPCLALLYSRSDILPHLDYFETLCAAILPSYLIHFDLMRRYCWTIQELRLIRWQCRGTQRKSKPV